MIKEEIIKIITDLMDMPEYDVSREFAEKRACNLIDKIENEQLIITDVKQQRETLIEFANWLFDDREDNHKEVDFYLKNK